MIPYLGDFVEDDVVCIMFNTFTSDDPSASATITNFINTDVHIHKDDGLTQRNNAAGITVSVNFDGITGSHLIKIDTSDNTVAGFWVTGHDYFVRIEGTTVDGATINAVVGHFSIQNRFMRGTDSAATAAALTTHDGKLDTADTVVDGIQTDLSNATDGLGALKALLDAIPTTAMRGTDGANTTVPDAAGVAPTAAEIKTAIEAAGSSIALILADTGELQTDWKNGGRLDNLLDACNTVVPDAAGVAPTAAEIKTAIEQAGSSIAQILADTNELELDWTNGGRLDLLIDAILLDTGTTLDAMIERILGMNQENFFVDNTTYTGGNLTSARIRIYSVAGSVGTASDVIATYTVTATYAGSEMASYKVVKS